MRALAFLVLCGAVLSEVAFGQTTLEQTGKVKLEFVKMFLEESLLDGTPSTNPVVNVKKSKAKTRPLPYRPFHNFKPRSLQTLVGSAETSKALKCDMFGRPTRSLPEIVACEIYQRSIGLKRKVFS